MITVPGILLPICGISLNTAGTVIARWSGACLTGIGIICWYSSASAKSDLLRGVLLALFICDSIGFVTPLLGQLAGMANTLGWSTVGLWLVLALGLGCYRFISKEA